MILTDLIAVSTAIASIAGLVFAIFSVFRLNRKVDRFEGLADSVNDFLRFELDADGNVLLDERATKLIDGVSTAFSSKMAESLKMSFLGQLSGNARLEKGLEGALAADMVENNMPLLKLAGDFFGINTISYIKKNPRAVGQLMQMAAPFLKNLQPNNGSNMQGVMK